MKKGPIATTVSYSNTYKAYESEDDEGDSEAQSPVPEPPEPAKIPPVLSDPAEAPILLALPEYPPDSNYLDTSHAQPEGDINVPEVSHDHTHKLPDSDAGTITPNPSVRPRRQTKRPKYLDDYVI